MKCLLLAWMLAGAVCVTPAAAALNDYGDAPDGTPAGYGNSVVGHFPSLARSNGARHTKWRPLTLGHGVSGETDSRQVDADRFDDGFSAELVPCQVSHVQFAINAAGLPAALRTGAHHAYLNAWFDFNRDGRWSGSAGCGGRRATEWAVRNVAISLASFAAKPIQVVQVDVLAGPATKAIWQRATLTLDQKAKRADGGGRFRYGETEDYGPRPPAATNRSGGRGKSGTPLPEPKPGASCRAYTAANTLQPPGMPAFLLHGNLDVLRIDVYSGHGNVTETVGQPQVLGDPPAGVSAAIVPAGARPWNQPRGLWVASTVKDFRVNPLQLVDIPVNIRGPGVGKLRVDCLVVIAHAVLTPAGANTFQPQPPGGSEQPPSTTPGQTVDTTVGPPTITIGGSSGGSGGGGSTTITG